MSRSGRGLFLASDELWESGRFSFAVFTWVLWVSRFLNLGKIGFRNRRTDSRTISLVRKFSLEWLFKTSTDDDESLKLLFLSSFLSRIFFRWPERLLNLLTVSCRGRYLRGERPSKLVTLITGLQSLWLSLASVEIVGNEFRLSLIKQLFLQGDWTQKINWLSNS
jgi:hypothetical protein